VKVSNLDVRCDRSQKQHLEIWCECYSIEDVDDLMAWLLLAKDMMRKWDKIRAKRNSPELASSSGARPLREADTAERAAGEETSSIVHLAEQQTPGA